MPRPFKYFVINPKGDESSHIDFDLRYGLTTTAGQDIVYNGSGSSDSIFIRPGLSYDLTGTAEGVDKIYLTGQLSDYTLSRSGTTLILTSTVDAAQWTLKVAGSGGDRLIFSDGTVNTLSLLQHVSNPINNPKPTPAGETSINPQGAAGANASLSSTVKAYVTESGGGTVATVKPGMALVANGSTGVDTVYVAEGSFVDASGLGEASDLIYMRGTWEQYGKSIDRDCDRDGWASKQY